MRFKTIAAASGVCLAMLLPTMTACRSGGGLPSGGAAGGDSATAQPGEHNDDHGAPMPGGGGGGGGGGYAKGPDPTQASVSALRGPFAISQQRVPRGNGFGGGTIYYPTQPGTYGGISVTPGFTALQSSIQWYGPRLASQGFVVFTIDTNTVMDFPAQRASQMLAALDYLTTRSQAASKVDKSRLAVMGWSMGGGGSLDAVKRRPSLKAAIPLAGWETMSNMAAVRVPTLVVACAGDVIAPPAVHSQIFYSTLGAREKAYMQISSAGGHFCVTTPNTTIAKYSIAWMKRFLDEDTRYTNIICSGSPAGATGWKSTCPM